MDPTNSHSIPISPARVKAAATPSSTTSDFVHIDLKPPQAPSEATNPALVPPSLCTDLGLRPQNPTSGSHDGSIATLPLTSVGPNPAPALQLPTSMGTNPAATDGKTDPAQSSNPSVGMNPIVIPWSLASSGLVVPPLSQPPSDTETGTTQNCSGNGWMSSGVNSGKCQPPPTDMTPALAATSCPANIDITVGVAMITEAVAKQAFLEYGKSKCCYGTAPAKDMTVQDLRPFNTYRYCLETFTESRTCEWVTARYNGQPVDSSTNASAPQPWDVPVPVPTIFKDGMLKMVVPLTSSLKACERCKGMGINMCPKCHGTGRVQCMWCNGTGRRMQMDMCHQCFGNGTESCRMCNSNQPRRCVSCAGKGQVLSYMLLHITWKNNIFQFISDHTSEFSTGLFMGVTGEKIFTDEQLSVPPLTNVPSLTRASQNALEQHQTQFSSSCRILRQRQSIELLPLTKVGYNWKGNQLSYFVYGKENQVYVQNYPQKCCCCLLM